MAQPNHTIQIDDDNANWVRWGELVRSWLAPGAVRPATVGQLRAKMTALGINGAVQGPNNRGITFVQYGATVADPIVIPLPAEHMTQLDEGFLDQLATQPVGHRRYPLPTFYAVAFGGAAMVDLSHSELRAMGKRRLGEYVVNECM